jgi:hypothetical protein
MAAVFCDVKPCDSCEKRRFGSSTACYGSEDRSSNHHDVKTVCWPHLALCPANMVSPLFVMAFAWCGASVEECPLYARGHSCHHWVTTLRDSEARDSSQPVLNATLVANPWISVK